MAVKTYLNNTRKISLFLVVLTFSAIAHAKIIYVDDNGPADFYKIQQAIDDANDRDIIIVNPGTYNGYGNRDIDFKGKKITVQSTDPNDPNIVDLTIIDCNHLGRGFFFHSGEDGNSILSGFTVMNGQAPIGGGIYCENQSGPTIANCVIKWNTADGRESGSFGGGISGCKGTIINCTISGNTAGEMFYGSGGGLYDCNGTITNCTISYNKVGLAGNGGGLSECNGDIINCTILRNWSAYYLGHVGRGGGLYRCNGAIINSTISGNSITADYEAYGGGLYECNGPIINCVIERNHVRCEYHVSAGGGLYRCDGPVINCTIWGNSTSTSFGIEAKGGGFYSCDGTISNCTISYNSAEGGWGYDEGSWGLGGGLYGCNGQIIDCVISDNEATVTYGTDWSGAAGGGLYGCSGTITNCTIIGNTASDSGRYEQRAFGGGLCGCDGTISNCTISGNIALSRYGSAGGGLLGCDGKIINCTINGNTATVTGEPAESESTGGGLSWCKGTIKNCTISENLTRDLGGGLRACGGTIIDCLITANRAGYGGGLEGCSSSSIISNCIISNNWADIGGGGLAWCTGRINNCLVSGNYSDDKGGGFYDYGGPVTNCVISGNRAFDNGGCIFTSIPPTLTNCTFSMNVSLDGRGHDLFVQCPDDTVDITMTNCIGGSIDYDADSIIWAVNYCCNTDAPGGIGNICADPCFVGPGHWADPNDPNLHLDPFNPDAIWIDGDYRLLPDSPCIDAGDPNYMAEPNEMDLDGKLRIIGCRIDMGAYEYGQIVPAVARIVPRTINLSKKEKWITAYLQLPEEYNIPEIDFCILRLENEIEPELCWFNEQQQVVIAGFNQEHLKEILGAGEVELTITAQFTNATCFQGTDVIKVIYEGGKKLVVLDKATNPNPTDGATDVNLITVLSWTADSSAKSHDVYFGTSNSPPFIRSQNTTTFDPGRMLYDTTYFWRIDEVNKLSKTTGDLWSFTTLMAPPPPPPPLYKASEPNPADGAIGTGLTADLSWKPGHDAISHDVYFGSANPPPFIGNQTATTFDPGTMDYKTTYYWRIDEVNNEGITTGDLWNFTTLMSPPP